VPIYEIPAGGSPFLDWGGSPERAELLVKILQKGGLTFADIEAIDQRITSDKVEEGDQIPADKHPLKIQSVLEELASGTITRVLFKASYKEIDEAVFQSIIRFGFGTEGLTDLTQT